MHPYLLHFRYPFTGRLLGVSTYAVLMLLGLGAGLATVALLARRRGLQRFDAVASGVLGFGFGFLGAKLLYLALNGPKVVAQYGWRALFAGGGFVWYGGLVAGAAAVLVYARAYRVPTLALADVAAPALALGQAFGRVGCFAAGCCYGRPAPGFPLAVVFPPGAIAPAGIARYPTQLFAVAGLLVLATVLVVLILRRPALRSGVVIRIYLMSYAALRYVVEITGGTIGGP